MKGIQVLMLIALFAISTCTSLFNKNLTEEEERQIKFTKEYLASIDDDIKNITNDPRTQIIIDAKNELKEINKKLLEDRSFYSSAIYGCNLSIDIITKDSASLYNPDDQIRVLRSQIDTYEDFLYIAKKTAQRESNRVYLNAYSKLNLKLK
jgi:hypothetical protein